MNLNDAQMGWETGMSTTAGVLGGADMLNMGGLLDALKTFDFAKAVIDDGIALMLKRLKRGITFNDEELAIDVIRQTGPGGSYMMVEHTADRMRTEAALPTLADREPRPVWKSKGSLDAHARALRKARDILAVAESPALSPDAQSRVLATFPGLAWPTPQAPKGIARST